MRIRLPVALLFLTLFPGLIAQVNSGSLHELEWILGTWERQNARLGVIHIEEWRKVSDHFYQGFGLAMSGSDTVLFEGLGIKAEEGTLYYIADVKENPAPVKFKIISLGKQSFISENPEHDAPKRIEYFLEGKIMTARVSWDQGGFDAVFMKLE